jgi:hypothetical protein
MDQDVIVNRLIYGRRCVNETAFVQFRRGQLGTHGCGSTTNGRIWDRGRRLLFKDPALRSGLDHLFMGAKMVAENPNPSGTAVMAQAHSGRHVHGQSPDSISCSAERRANRKWAPSGPVPPLPEGSGDRLALSMVPASGLEVMSPKNTLALATTRPRRKGVYRASRRVRHRRGAYRLAGRSTGSQAQRPQGRTLSVLEGCGSGESAQLR